MHTKLKQHFGYYFSLIAMESAGFIFVLLNDHDRMIQTYLILIMSAFYALWAIAHHYIHHTITAKIVIEYILIGVLGVTISTLLI